MAKFLPPDQVGLFGLFTAANAYLLYIVGIEFYMFSTREIVKNREENFNKTIKSHSYVSLLMFCVTLPLVAYFYFNSILNQISFVWFILIFITEYISQELNRIYVALEKPLKAGIILFFRSALWVYFVIYAMFLNEGTRKLEHILTAWTLGAGLACLFGAIGLIPHFYKKQTTRLDYNFIKKGLKTALPFFAAALAGRAIFTLDRYFVEDYAGLTALAAYLLFISVGNAAISLLDSGIFAFSYPNLIKQNHLKNTAEFKKQVKTLFFQVSASLIIFNLCALILIDPILKSIGRDSYIGFSWMLKYVLVAITIHCLGLIPQQILYSKHADKEIIYGQIFSFLIFLLSVKIIALYRPESAVLIGLILSMLSASLWFLIKSVRLMR